ncbi:unnamed protein product [Closterium sp. NIES-65]|nr:unnamed protein product [Closterium sp. NIES-65]
MSSLQDFHFIRTTPKPTWLPPSVPSASPLMRLASARSAPSPLASSPSLSRSPSRLTPAVVSTISSLSSQPQSFESVALAAVFGRLKRLSLVSCFCQKEEELVMLLHACPLFHLADLDWLKSRLPMSVRVRMPALADP